MFEQYAQTIHERFPSLTIVGDNYPPTFVKATLAQVLSVLKLVLIGLVISSYNPFPLINMQTPNLFSWAMENKVSRIMYMFQILLLLLFKIYFFSGDHHLYSIHLICISFSDSL